MPGRLTTYGRRKTLDVGENLDVRAVRVPEVVLKYIESSTGLCRRCRLDYFYGKGLPRLRLKAVGGY